MKLTCTTDDGRVAVIETAPSEPLENLAVLIEAEFGITIAQQKLYHNGRLVTDSPANMTKTLEQLSVGDDDMIAVSTGVAGAGDRTAPAVRRRGGKVLTSHTYTRNG